MKVYKKNHSYISQRTDVSNISIPFSFFLFFSGIQQEADISSMFGANRRIVGEELARRNEEYHNDEEIQKIAKQFETEKVRLKSCSQAPYFSSPNS